MLGGRFSWDPFSPPGVWSFETFRMSHVSTLVAGLYRSVERSVILAIREIIVNLLITIMQGISEYQLLCLFVKFCILFSLLLDH